MRFIRRTSFVQTIIAAIDVSRSYEEFVIVVTVQHLVDVLSNSINISKDEMRINLNKNTTFGIACKLTYNYKRLLAPRRFFFFNLLSFHQCFATLNHTVNSQNSFHNSNSNKFYIDVGLTCILLAITKRVMACSPELTPSFSRDSPQAVVQ